MMCVDSTIPLSLLDNGNCLGHHSFFCLFVWGVGYMKELSRDKAAEYKIFPSN
jgi:hypothetical protein